MEPTRRKPCGLPSAQSTPSFWHTEPSPLLLGHRSTRHLPQQTDVVIVGSGITGASVAHHFLDPADIGQEKLDVVLLEAREACWGATGRNGGRCQPEVYAYPEDPSIGRFEIRNLREIERLFKEKSIGCEFVAHTGVSAIYTKDRLIKAQRAWKMLADTAPDLARTIRITADRQELANFRVPTAVGAIVNENAARLWPYKLVARVLEDLLTSTCLAGTFNLQTLTPVTKIEKDPNTHRISVSTDRGTIQAKKVILATNGYTSHLLPTFADLIIPCRGQMSALVPLPSVAGPNRIKTSLGFDGDDIDGYLIQRPNESGCHLMFGGGGEAGHLMGATDDSEMDERTSHYLRSSLVEFLQLPEGGARRERAGDASTSAVTEMEATHMWTGIMGYSRDGKPWVGEVPDLSGVYIAAGYTGHGMPNAWLCGKFVAFLARSEFAEGQECRGEVGVAEDALSRAVAVTGLPESYLVSRKRMEKVMRVYA